MFDEKGVALTVVIFFATIALITVFSYLTHQMLYSKPSFRSPSSLQAQLNARSGIYRAFYDIMDSVAVDTLPQISTLDSAFGSTMFNGLPDTTMQLNEKPQLDGTPVTYLLFPEDSLGECEITLEPTGGTCILKSIGKFRNVTRTVAATLGCRAPALADTVVIYRNNLPWDGSKPQGTLLEVNEEPVINTSWYNQLIDRYQTDLTETDTLLLDEPLIIQNNYDLQKIDSVINGPLLIDGGNIDINWRDTGRIIVKGDLQVTGEVIIEGISFVVSGEIKLLDEARIKRCNFFSTSRIFIGDRAHFEGNALALHSIAVYGKAEVTGRSSLIAGSSRNKASKSNTADSLKFNILLSEECVVDAICIALGTPGSIKTDQLVEVTGILWARHFACHRGRMSGLICAARLVDCDDPLQMAVSSDPVVGDTTPEKGTATGTSLPAQQLFNKVNGDLEPLNDIHLYYLPFFIGRLSIVAWKEWQG